MHKTQTLEWHVGSWGLWGWVETILKLIGIVAGLLAFAGSNAAAPLVLANNPELGAVIVLTLLTLAWVGALIPRFQQREVISMVFAIINALAHVGLLIALLRSPDQRTLAIVFGVFFILGQLAKDQFLRLSGYTEGGQTTNTMVKFSRGMAAFYLLFVVLLLL
jgi:hypothetical protein